MFQRTKSFINYCRDLLFEQNFEIFLVFIYDQMTMTHFQQLLDLLSNMDQRFSHKLFKIDMNHIIEVTT